MVVLAGNRALVGAVSPGADGVDVTIRAPKSLLGGPPVRVAGGFRDPAEVVAHLLAFLMDVASAHLGRRPAGGDLTAPPWFDAAWLRSLERAADLARIGVEARILDHTAVALTALARAPGLRRLGVIDAGAGVLGAGIYRVVARRLVLEGVAGDRVHGDDPARLREACEGCAWIALDQAGRGILRCPRALGGASSRAGAPRRRGGCVRAAGDRGRRCARRRRARCGDFRLRARPGRTGGDHRRVRL